MYSKIGHRWQHNTAHALCVLDNYGYGRTLRIVNIYAFHGNNVYVHCLSCFMWIPQLRFNYAWTLGLKQTTLPIYSCSIKVNDGYVWNREIETRISSIACMICSFSLVGSWMHHYIFILIDIVETSRNLILWLKHHLTGVLRIYNSHYFGPYMRKKWNTHFKYSDFLVFILKLTVTCYIKKSFEKFYQIKLIKLIKLILPY